ncbi:MAG: ABC transporter permease [Chloroflexi bacterium]|nr:ABC transporter permease [Anaerolineaceae bacterium]NLI44827.1 ABC transporter permease [Chloroflexota bacterium]HOE35706.1 ABC transporter permease [Anaerolineaceae bacterium]HOT26263.1 ABC transporter permease [Anaerolineaceae bacterium]HQH58212.1 ABC transporter permease [Anaerolineaceae bacterium]
MATLTQTIKHRRISEVSPARRLFMGIVELIIGILIYVLFAARLAPELLTTFNMTPGGIDVGQLADWVVPSRLTLTIFAIVCVGIGAYQIVKGFGRATNGMVGLCGLLLIFGFLIWQASGKTLNLSGMLSSAVLLAVPITLAAFAGILAERSGTINIAIEGMMLMSCMFAALIGSLTKSAVLGLLGGVLSAVALAMLHAVLCIKYKINQVVSGTVINIFSAGMTAFISQKFLQKYQTLNNPPMFTRIPVPLLSRIPFIGPILFNQNVFVYMMFLILIILQVALFSTRWGLRLRSVGEHPKAADTLGIDVIRTRYVGMLLSGVVAGIAGAFFTLGSVGRFDEGMTAGKGFIGLAAMIFGNWYPFGALGAGLLFGFADAIGSKLSLLGSAIPPQFMGMAPYLITMIVLAGFIGKGQAPAAEGKPYEKE